MSVLASAILVALKQGLTGAKIYSILIWQYSACDLAAAFSEILNQDTGDNDQNVSPESDRFNP